jgi:hypothetical protein
VLAVLLLIVLIDGRARERASREIAHERRYNRQRSAR